MSTGDPNYDVPCDMACDAYKDAIASPGYRFPAINDVIMNSTRHNQVNKLLEEVREVKEASGFEQVLEAMDLIHACETLIRMHGISDENFAKVADIIRTKNEVRGYYGDAS